MTWAPGWEEFDIDQDTKNRQNSVEVCITLKFKKVLLNIFQISTKKIFQLIELNQL